MQREFTVEVTAKYVVKIEASNEYEAKLKAGDLVLLGIEPDYMDDEILAIRPVKKKEKA